VQGVVAVLAFALLAPAAAGTAVQAGGGPIAVPEIGRATPFPSTIVVSGQDGAIQKVTVTLRGLRHGCPIDLDVQLTSPEGTSVILMSDAGAPPGGGCPIARGVDLTFDDDAAIELPDAQLRSGRFRPAAYGEDDPALCGPEEGGPAPDLSGEDDLAAFAGEDPRGSWRLSVVDDCVQDAGSIAGWSLDIRTTNDPVADPAVPDIDGLTISPRCIEAPARPAAVTVSYLLSEDATVSYQVARRVDSARWRDCPGPRIGGRPGRYENAGSRTEPTQAGMIRRALPAAGAASATTAARAGHRRVSLATLLQGARLRQGTYLLTVVARDAAGGRSAVERSKFWVLGGSRDPARITRTGRLKNERR
jgi:subtilisin-like proprotein convertase family protein